MDQKVKVLILRTAGTNCDQEMGFAFSSFGAQVDFVHIKKIVSHEVSLKNYHILGIPGGFTYGDDIESGRILANELHVHLKHDIRRFVDDGKLIIGICNGFQILTKAGILPDVSSDEQSVTLTNNDSGKFEDRWCHMKPEGKSIWAQGLDGIIYLPVAHAEGKFLTAKPEMLKRLEQNGQVVFRYCSSDGKAPVYPENPNGSTGHIAGITDTTGRVLGMMPHPERHFLFTHHPFWTRKKNNEKYGQGAKIFQNAVEYVKKNLL